MNNNILCAILILSSCIDLIFAKVSVGVIKSNSGWEFIDRFCFYPNIGKLYFTFTYPMLTSETAPKILAYPDTLWLSVYKNDSKNCQQKEATIDSQTNQIFYLSPAEGWTNCRKVTTGGTSPIMNCSAMLTFQSARERWWFIVVSNCAQPIDLSYDLLLLNGDGVMTKQFSADEFYILEVDIAFLFTFVSMLAMSVVFAKKLKDLNYLHITYKLFVYSLAFKTLHLFVFCVGLGKFSADGLDVYSAKVIGHVVEALAFLSFILLLILLGKGLTVTRGRISMESTIKITVFMVVYVCVYIALFIWEAVVFDPALVLYRYDSYPGYCLLVIQVIAWMWFSYAIFFTVKHFPEKNPFYYPFYVLYTAWFLAGPACILIVNLALALWVREKIANGIFHTINFFGYAFLLFLTRPSKANKNFPYHIKATQVAAMGTNNNNTNNNNHNDGNGNDNEIISDNKNDDNKENNDNTINSNRLYSNSEFYDIFNNGSATDKVDRY